MASVWEEFIDGLTDTAGVLAKAELKNLIAQAKSDADEFIKRQGKKTERYLTQLALGEITPAQFQGYMEDIRDLTQAESLKMRVAAKASAQRVSKGIEDLILNGLMRLL